MPKHPRTWTTLRRTIKYCNSWITVREDQVIRPDGNRGIYGVVEKPPGVFIIPFDGRNVYLVKQYRYTIGKTIYEVPAGVMIGTSIIANARRELMEETGMTAGRMQVLGSYYIGAGHETTRAHAIVATNLQLTTIHVDNQDGDESISEVVKIPLSRLTRMIKTGRIECGITLAALMLFSLWKTGQRIAR